MQSAPLPRSRFDGPFWLALVGGVLVLGALGCFGLAAAATAVAPHDTGVLVIDAS
jgi:hypothetical protein